jgi:hypothetical protein
MGARQRCLTEAAQRARQEAGRARRLADTQTRTEVIEDLRAYAGGLERNAVLFEQQAAEFARTLATTRRLTDEIQKQTDAARARLQEMAERLKKPE